VQKSADFDPFWKFAYFGHLTDLEGYRRPLKWVFPESEHTFLESGQNSESIPLPLKKIVREIKKLFRTDNTHTHISPLKIIILLVSFGNFFVSIFEAIAKLKIEENTLGFIIVSIIDALYFLEAHNLVHGGIKSQNIFITSK
jgi:serine/threonine protein kinase